MVDYENIDNITTSSKELIKRRIDFLNQKEKELKGALEEGKTKEEELRNRLSALKTMVEKASKGNISFDEEIAENKKEKHKKKKERSQSKKHKIAKTIGKVALIGALTTGAILGVNELRKNRQKDQVQREDDKKNTDQDQKIDSTATFPTKTLITEDMLKKNITQDELGSLISYEHIVNTINKIENDKVREELIGYLKEGKIVEAQEMYGMKRDSKYTSNKATGKIDANTLQRFSDNLFGLYGKDILENKDIPQEVKNAYEKFLLGEIDNNGSAYIILCKSNFTLYLFTKNHKLLHRQITLLGEDMEKNQERIPYPYYETNKGRIYHKNKVNTDTPEGLFLIQRTCQLTDNYLCDGPKVGLVAVPINEKTQKIDARYEYNKYEKRFHPIRQPPEDPDKYEDAMDSEDTKDNAISHGCPNLKNIGIAIDNLTIGKSVEYTTHK